VTGAKPTLRSCCEEKLMKVKSLHIAVKFTNGHRYERIVIGCSALQCMDGPSCRLIIVISLAAGLSVTDIHLIIQPSNWSHFLLNNYFYCSSNMQQGYFSRETWFKHTQGQGHLIDMRSRPFMPPISLSLSLSLSLYIYIYIYIYTGYKPVWYGWLKMT